MTSFAAVQNVMKGMEPLNTRVQQQANCRHLFLGAQELLAKFRPASRL